MTSRKILKRAMLLPLAVILLLLSTLLYTQVFAKYFTQDQASDSAHTAHFDIREDLKDQTLNLALLPGESFTVTFSNHSEVDVSCVLRVDNKTGNLPILTQTYQKDIEAGDTTTYQFTVEWPLGQSGSEFAGKVDLIQVTLTCQQID
jgi:hypothetical protein